MMLLGSQCHFIQVMQINQLSSFVNTGFSFELGNIKCNMNTSPQSVPASKDKYAFSFDIDYQEQARVSVNWQVVTCISVLVMLRS